MLAALIGPVMAILDKVIPDPTQRDKAKAEMAIIVAKAQADEMKAKASVVVAEATGESWMQRNWRPVLMFTFIAIIINNFLLLPYMIALGLPIPHLELPDQMWYLLSIGVGGYIAGRSGEKITNSINKKKFYSNLRDEQGSVSQEEVERLEKAFKDM